MTAVDRSRRPVGTKAGIDRDLIVTAARSLPLQGVTMQAVASVLGVDRSALNHHVKNREQLLQLVAQATFADGFAEIARTPGGDWRDASRAFTRAYAEAVVLAGPLAEHLTETIQEERFLRATEVLLGDLVEAGFTDESAVRYLVVLGYVARGFALDRIGIEAGGELRRSERTQAALRERGREAFPNLDRVSANPFDTYGAAQLEAAIDVVVSGADAALRATLPR